MLKCTYIILLNNNENNIDNLINSLKAINGNFRKEFIIVDDGSEDNSLNVAKAAVNDLPRTTIISQEKQGFAVSVNKAISLASGDYIHFVEGDEVVNPFSTGCMIDSCIKFGTEVACFLPDEPDEKANSNINDNSVTFYVATPADSRLVQNPIAEILLNKSPALRNIGASGSLVSRNLLERVNKADEGIYSQTMSLSLRCAKHSKFVLINNILSFKRKSDLPVDSNFELYNNLQAIYKFAVDNPEICNDYRVEMMDYLSLQAKTTKAKIKYYSYLMEAKYLKLIKLDTILKFYKTEYEKLF